jgi:uncharacterized protein (TIGR02284 family)
MEKQQVIETLNNLLAITKDGERGFRICAGAVTSLDLKMELESAARRCVEGALELEMKIRTLGGEPAASGTVTGALHRAWTDIVPGIMERGDCAVLDECKRGEDVAKQAYEDALVEDLPADVEVIVRRQYQGVTENHERIRELRNLAADDRAARTKGSRSPLPDVRRSPDVSYH